jgi:hypothetical protein
VVTEGTLPKCSLHGIRRDFNAIGAVRYVEELAIALRLREGHEPWCTKVPEDLRFAVEGLNKLPNLCRSRNTHHLDAICLIHGSHHLRPYSQGEGHKNGVDVIDYFSAIDFWN